MAKGGQSENDKTREYDYRANQSDKYLQAVLDDMVSPQRHGLWERFMGELPRAEAEKSGIQNQLSGLAGKYGQFADTGGYSPEDIANIRARAISPIRSVYSRSLAELDRHKALQGGYMPNYAAARAKMAREQSYATSDATTNAEAAIAEMRNKGKLAGLAGMGDTIGQGANLYRSTPGLAGMFGQGAMDSTGQALQLGGLRNQLTGNLIDASMGRKPGWGISDWAKFGGNALGSIGTVFSDKNMKEDITDVKTAEIIDKFRSLPIKRWKYKGDDEEHVGPMAQDFQKVFNKGDGRTIKLVDVIGETLALGKALAENANV